MEKQNLENLNALLDLLAKGEFLQGMETYFADDVAIQELDEPARHGKTECIVFEKQLLESVAEFIQYTAHTKGAGGDQTFYEATMEFKTTDGKHVKQNQVVVTTWKDGKVFRERYYHGNT